MELWDLYNEHREMVGRDHIREEEIPAGCFHLVVHVWMRNTKGEYLISQRSAHLRSLPLMWECVGGSVLKGEDSLTGALREVEEEVGVALSPEKGKRIQSVLRRTINGKAFNDILDIWLFEYDGPVDLAQATTQEVAQVAWRSKAQIKELFDTGQLVHTLEYFFHHDALL